MKKLIIFYIVLLFSIPISYAEDNYAVRSYLPCGTFLTSCDESSINCGAQQMWALGYISALSWTKNVDYPGSVFNADNVKYALIKYCKANPFSDTHEGAEDIFNQLQ